MALTRAYKDGRRRRTGWSRQGGKRPPPRPIEPDPGPAPRWDAQGRPSPGLDTRAWDHDGATLFADTYRLGPRWKFTWRGLLDHLEELRSGRHL